jgi:hypothetical protein
MQMNLTRSQSSTPPTNPFPEKQKALHPIWIHIKFIKPAKLNSTIYRHAYLYDKTTKKNKRLKQWQRLSLLLRSSGTIEGHKKGTH